MKIIQGSCWYEFHLSFVEMEIVLSTRLDTVNSLFYYLSSIQGVIRTDHCEQSRILYVQIEDGECKHLAHNLNLVTEKIKQYLDYE